MRTRLVLPLLVFAGVAAAQEAEAPAELAPEEAHAFREQHMRVYAANLQVLGPMAQGAAPFDAAAAQAAADAIYDNATSENWQVMWPEGSAQGEVPDSEALPAIWEDPEGFEAAYQAHVEAATALQAGAGTLEGLQGALGGLGASCGGCHQNYRAPS